MIVSKYIASENLQRRIMTQRIAGQVPSNNFDFETIYIKRFQLATKLNIEASSALEDNLTIHK